MNGDGGRGAAVTPADLIQGSILAQQGVCRCDLTLTVTPLQKHGGEPIIPFSGKFESTLFDMPDDEKAVYCKEVRLQLAIAGTPAPSTSDMPFSSGASSIQSVLYAVLMHASAP